MIAAWTVILFVGMIVGHEDGKTICEEKKAENPAAQQSSLQEIIPEGMEVRVLERKDDVSQGWVTYKSSETGCGNG